jgi:ribosomal protein S18 acetylase RimI-like enzyme
MLAALFWQTGICLSKGYYVGARPYEGSSPIKRSKSLITVREITECDMQRVVDVIRAAFEEYRGRLDPPSSAHHKTAEIVRRELMDGGAFVACDLQTIVGCVFYHVHPDHIYLDRLAVLPSRRRQGIARELIRSVEEHVRQYGLGEVRLSVRIALESQRAYYERLGYTFLNYGTHDGYTTPTSVILRKQVEDLKIL